MSPSQSIAARIVIACALSWLCAETTSAQADGAAERGEVKPPRDPTGITYAPSDPNAMVTFNLEDVDLPELVRMMSQLTGRGFIVASARRSIKATVYAPIKVRAADAYEAFLSILELNGMTVVPAAPYYKVVESAKIESRPVPLSVGVKPTATHDAYVTTMRRLQFVSAEDALDLLARYKSDSGGLSVYAPTNMLILTDTAANLQRMERLLDQLDVPRPARATRTLTSSSGSSGPLPAASPSAQRMQN
ncbi:MAG TPA: secretin N-terminal domain-containing protein [Polyangiales bacterium]|nr:secretin N-terminal domain-containing protein [Polyangiales bacterium]